MKARHLVFGLLATAACQKAAAPSTAAPPPEPSRAVLPTIGTQAGTAEAYGALPKRSHLWTIHWTSARIETGQKTVKAGTLAGVTGTVYKEGVPANRFSADTGEADQTSETMTLRGHVHVVSLVRKAEIVCDQMVYTSHPALVRARGNVSMRGVSGSVGTFSELLATPDLARMGTPDLFNAR